MPVLEQVYWEDASVLQRDYLVQKTIIQSISDAELFCHTNYHKRLPTGCSWSLTQIKESPGAMHYTFSPACADSGVIYGVGLRLHVSKSGALMFVQEHIPEGLHRMAAPLASSATHVVYDGSGYVYGALETRMFSAEKRNVFVTDDGRIYDLGATKMYYGQSDTPIHVHVYYPNPIVSQKTTYAGLFQDLGDGDNDSLNAARQWHKTKGSFNNGAFQLRSGYLRFGHVSDPVTPETRSLSDSFDFTRSQLAFEDVNAYFHLVEYSEYLETLGFKPLLDSVIIDAHAFNGADASAFDPSVYPYTLEFGEGGVDDAEDAQVVVHEFGHALSTVAAPGTREGNQRRAMEEGNADYFSMSYSRSISEHAWEKVFSWDGHNEFWNGFWGNSAKRYPLDIEGNSDNDREIWSSALMCIWEQLGRGRTDSLILNSLFYQVPQMTMPQMAEVILKLNRELFQNEKQWAVQNCFGKQGILPFSGLIQAEQNNMNLPFSVFQTDGFSKGSDPLRISLYGHAAYRIRITDMLGNLVWQEEGKSHEIKVYPDQLPSPGMYLMMLSLSGNEYPIKLIRL